MILVLDTHALVWFLEGSSRLSAEARSAMAATGAEIVIPAIVLAEVAYLFGHRRIGIDVPSVLDHVCRADNCTVYPLDEVVVRRLPMELNIHDGLIVATALIFRDVLGRDVAVVTKDGPIRQSGIVETVW